MTTATNTLPEKLAGTHVIHLGRRWSIMNQTHLDYFRNLWWQVGYSAGLAAAARGERP